MESSFFEPSSPCSSLVRYYVHMKNSDEECADKFIPDGNIAIVFNFADDHKYIESEITINLPPHFITIPLIQSLKFRSTTLIDSFIIVCKASVFTRLFDIRLGTPRPAPFLEIELFNGFPMFESLAKLSSFEKRVELFEKYLNEHICNVKYMPDEIDLLYDKIIQSNGYIRIGSLIQNTEINYRSFRRNFLMRVGLSSKELLRIVRVNYIWKTAMEQPAIDFHEIVYKCHFFDQSHFINDFKKIIGETPQNFFSRKLNKVEFISGRRVNNNT